MFQRFLITYAILTFGFTFISFGMMFNGSDYPGNPAWPFVTGVRNFLLLAGVTVAGGVGLLEFLATSGESVSAKEGREGLPKVLTEAEQKADQAAREAREKARMEREEENRKVAEIQAREQEEARKRQEELKRQAEKKRRKRTAEEAANTGLDDFL